MDKTMSGLHSRVEDLEERVQVLEERSRKRNSADVFEDMINSIIPGHVTYEYSLEHTKCGHRMELELAQNKLPDVAESLLDVNSLTWDGCWSDEDAVCIEIYET